MAKAGKLNGVVIQGLASKVNGVNRDNIEFYDRVERDYITYRIKTDQATSGVTTCRCKVNSSSGTVYWGDGTFDDYTSSLDIFHDYGVAGTYDIYLYTDGFLYSDVGNSERPKYLAIRDLRKQKFTAYIEYNSMSNMVVETNAGAPLQQNTTRPGRAFYNCDSIVTVNASQWLFPDPPTIVYFMDSMFAGCALFNDAGVSVWDINKVREISSMFDSCLAFNVDLSDWATRIPRDDGANRAIVNLFAGCASFTNGGVGGVGLGLDSWDTSTVSNMQGLFSQNCAFNDRLDSWDTGVVTNMSNMFTANSTFNNGGVSGVGLGIDNWDTSKVTTMQNMFERFTGGTSFYLGSWDTSLVTNMNRMFGTNTYIFSDWPTLNPTGLNNWNVSLVEDMGQMFRHNNTFDQPLNNWNTGNVTNMTQMFSGGYSGDISFNQDIGSWDVRKVTSFKQMFGMFGGSPNHAFNNGGSNSINNWVTTAAVSMQGMFLANTSFNQPVHGWDMNGVQDCNSMFSGATAFNNGGVVGIGNWDMTTVTDCSGMFSGATSFNQDLSLWDMGLAGSCSDMFRSATAFNNGGATMANWDMSNCTAIDEMFRNCTSFDQAVTNWNTGLIEDMTFAFANTAFDQDISGWNIASLTNAGGIISFGTPFGKTNYDLLLDNTTGWPSQNPNIQSGVSLSTMPQYTSGGAAETGRNLLTGTYGWTIVDGGPV